MIDKPGTALQRLTLKGLSGCASQAQPQSSHTKQKVMVFWILIYLDQSGRIWSTF
jgi:hypothetical protein